MPFCSESSFRRSLLAAVLMVMLLPTAGCRHPLLGLLTMHSHRPDPFLNEDVVRQCSSGSQGTARGSRSMDPRGQMPAIAVAPPGRSEVVALDDEQSQSGEEGDEAAAGVVEVVTDDLDGATSEDVEGELAAEAPAEAFAETAKPGPMLLPLTARTAARPQ